ncbi:MarR family winged helix-turn-helix transcriptional regulator [Actinoalloteichus caeruleus]|uniref:MarR family winged helix-turn-helix transcriptional regulator n=1 Tax=Actinoalloteichus cyanogriseus TaxID=2893586 RepID=UPI0006911927|nr:MarR family transcriptional regulator [Actinoalloteichus caeruleus]
MDREAQVERIVRQLPLWMSAVDAVNDGIAREAGISASDLACLHEVIVDGPLPAGELARRLRLTTGAITHLVERLVRAGWVRRFPDDTDRRRVLVEALPGTGERMMASYAPLDRTTRTTLSEFTADELAVIARFVEGGLGATRTLVDGDA